MQKHVGLKEMIHNLLQVDDETWGLYAFSREILNKHLQLNKKTEMIAKAIACGKEYAQRIILENGTSDIHTISEKLNIKIEFHGSSIIGKRILFANYTPPDKIEIMEEPVHKAILLISKEAPILIEHFKQNVIISIILGHEIFHFVEDQFVQNIYTRTEKILLWSFMGIKNYSTIRTLGEIGAMAFTKEINGLKYSPFILDVLLYYAYDFSGAKKIYHDILGMSSGR